MKRFNQYIEDVISGRQVTGELTRLAVERHIKDAEKSWHYQFDEQLAGRAVRFFELLHHWKGEWAGTPIRLEPHQVFYVASLFGWIREDGQRRFRTSFKEVARKNAKTTETAGKAIFHLLKDGEAGPQVYFAATKEDQARIGFRDVQEIVRKTPGLKDYLRVMTKSVLNEANGGFIKHLGSDSDTQDGFDPSWAVIDEYHAHRTDEMLNVLESGMGARRQPVIDVITTAGFKKEYPCYSNLRKVSIDVLRGIKQDDTLLALIYEMDKDDDWQDETVWVKSNPNLNVSVKLDFLQTRLKKAINEGGTKEIDFKTKNLNMWTDSSDTWIQDDVWMKGAGPLPDLKGVKCWAGLDLASVRDITALVLVFPVEGRFYTIPYLFIPESAVQSREEMDYRGWVNDGYMIETPGDVTDYNYIKAVISEVRQKYNLQMIAYDRFNSSQLVIDLVNEGVPMAPFGQGFLSMSAPSKELESICYKGLITHGGHPVMRWMCSNVVLKTDPAGNIKLDKANSTNKIDGMVALVMALGEYMAKVEPPPQVNIRLL